MQKNPEVLATLIFIMQLRARFQSHHDDHAQCHFCTLAVSNLVRPQDTLPLKSLQDEKTVHDFTKVNTYSPFKNFNNTRKM